MFATEKDSISEIFKKISNVDFNDFEKRVMMLHHDFIKMVISPELNDLTSVDNIQILENEAEYILSVCSHPTRIKYYTNQHIRDGFSISATIFEFLGDIAHKNKEYMDSKDFYYLKSALCYSLSGYECRTSVISCRLLSLIIEPDKNISKNNISQWTFLIISLFLKQGKSQIFNDSFRQNILNGLNNFKKEISLGDEFLSDFSIYINIIESCLLVAEAFHNGNEEIKNKSIDSLRKAKKTCIDYSDTNLFFICDSLLDIIDIFWNNSPWKKLEGIINNRKYIQSLINNGVTTFWTSQLQALEMKSTKIDKLNGGYLDNRIERVVINMPTSSGKTLIAELAIAKKLLENKNDMCVYVGWNIAIVDEITKKLSHTFRPFGIRVLNLKNDFDDSMMTNFLLQKARIFVTTPEKLNYLIRKDNNFFEKVKIFIFDELHNISDSGRGWIYEETISLLMQKFIDKETKMIFMSAIMANNIAIKEWVDIKDLSSVVYVPWQPTRQLKGVIRENIEWEKNYTKKGDGYADLFFVRNKSEINSPFVFKKILPTKNIYYKDNKWRYDDKNWQYDFFSNLVDLFIRFGQVMIFFPLKRQIRGFAKFLSEKNSFNKEKDYELLEEMIDKLVDFQLPKEHPLINYIKKGIAYHDSSLSSDVRNEIENGFKKGIIKLIVTSKTLIEGVNLPVKTFILTDYCQRVKEKDQWVPKYPLSKRDFKNLIGRVGRAFHDTEGQLIFCQLFSDDMEWKNYFFIDSNDSDLNIESSLSDKEVQNELIKICDFIDSGELSIEEIITDEFFNNKNFKTKELLKKIQSYANIQSLELKDKDIEEKISEYIGKYTFVGKEDYRNINVSRFVNYTIKALNVKKLSIEERIIFKSTGLSIQSCYKLKEGVLQLLNNFFDIDLHKEIDEKLLEKIAKIILPLYELKPKFRSYDFGMHCEVLKKWIFQYKSNDMELFDFFKDKFYREKDIEKLAELYNDYKNDLLCYKAPWGFSSFYTFFKFYLKNDNLDKTILGKDLSLLASYSKFGVYRPSSSMFCSVGLNSSELASKLSFLYEDELIPEYHYNFKNIIEWFMLLDESKLFSFKDENTLSEKEINKIIQVQKDLDITNFHEKLVIKNIFISSWIYFQKENLPDSFKEGDLLTIIREKNNHYDIHALKLMYNNNQIGYIPKRYSELIDKYLELGENISVYISKIDKNTTIYNQITIDIIQE